MSAMDCAGVRLALLDHHRARLAPEEDAAVLAHLESCAACRHEDAVELALTDALEARLAQHPGSLALKRRLAAQWPTSVPARAVPARRAWRPLDARRWWLPAAAFALALLALGALLYERAVDQPAAVMIAEAVNDHLRGLDGRRPVEVTSSEFHRVKPWFGGRLDFAPVVAFTGDDEFPLRGGAVEYFLDRKAAVFVYGRRLHTISLLVFRADALPWPTSGLTPLGHARALVTVARGYHVVLWRQGELGYAAVSDVDAADLRELALRVAG
jgi:anti-sigma factor RsiW